MNEGEISVNGQNFRVPKKDETLHIHAKDNTGTIKVKISGVDGGRVMIDGGTISNHNPDRKTAEQKLEKDLKRFCYFIHRGVIHKSDLESQVVDMFDPKDSVTTVTIKDFYKSLQEAEGWTPWDEISS